MIKKFRIPNYWQSAGSVNHEEEINATKACEDIAHLNFVDNKTMFLHFYWKF
jgi:hypothetical protein